MKMSFHFNGKLIKMVIIDYLTNVYIASGKIENKVKI